MGFLAVPNRQYLMRVRVGLSSVGTPGHERAKKILAILEKVMTSEQKAEAMKLAWE
jgi:hypothetical protein